MRFVSFQRIKFSLHRGGTMGSIYIRYFSSTGNTERAAKLLAEQFKAAGFQPVLINILKNTELKGEPDKEVFLYPTFSWSAPAIVKRYISALPEKTGTKAAVVAVFGGDGSHDGNAGQGVSQVARMLRRKGYDVFLTGGMGYPTNWIQFSNPPAQDSCATMREKTDRRLKSFGIKFLNEEKDFYRASVIGYILSTFMAAFFGLMGRRMMGKMFTADDSCTQCRLCEKACPVHTITMTGRGGKPNWGSNCENCNRCMNICPPRSIQTSLPRTFLHFAFQIGSIVLAVKTGSFAASHLHLNAVPKTALAVISFMIAFVLLFIIQLTFFDALLRTLQKVKIIDRFFALTFTRKFRRYIAPGFKH
jgi:flavodoxin/Pyruvate/2-oxoacid:ferredoxin oxidoreductase delta subunit